MFPEYPLNTKSYGIIYCITNTVNGRQYVGQTTKEIKRRWGQHQTAAMVQNRPYPICHAIRKYGAPAFDVEILDVASDRADLNAKETHWISAMNTKAPNGYNLTTGGEGTTGAIMTPEARAKMSTRHKGVPKSPEHREKIRAANRGHIHAPETKAKIGTAHRGRKNGPHSPETNAKIQASNMGHKVSPEARAKISAARKGQPRSPESIKRTADALRGRTHTPEQVEGVAAANRGKKRTPEAIARMKAGKQLARARREHEMLAQQEPVGEHARPQYIAQGLEGYLQFGPAHGVLGAEKRFQLINPSVVGHEVELWP